MRVTIYYDQDLKQQIHMIYTLDIHLIYTPDIYTWYIHMVYTPDIYTWYIYMIYTHSRNKPVLLCANIALLFPRDYSP